MSNKTETYIANGQMIFIQTKDGLKERICDREYYLNEFKKDLLVDAENYVNYIYDSKFTFTTTNLISGKKFLRLVLSERYNNDNGLITEIFVNGFKSNLGLITDKFVSGEGCLLDEDVWKDMCNKYNIEVNWKSKCK